MDGAVLNRRNITVATSEEPFVVRAEATDRYGWLSCDQDLKWTCNQEGIVTVGEDGQVKINLQNAGQFTITATAVDGSKKTASFTLTVK